MMFVNLDDGPTQLAEAGHNTSIVLMVVPGGVNATLNASTAAVNGSVGNFNFSVLDVLKEEQIPLMSVR